MIFNILRTTLVVFLLITLLTITGCKTDAAFQINDVVSDPGAFSGALTIEGVVYAYAQDDAMVLGVMDKKELQCTTPNCNKALLAVKVNNPRPAIGDEVIISGAMSKKIWGYLMEATEVKVMKNHKLGGKS